MKGGLASSLNSTIAVGHRDKSIVWCRCGVTPDHRSTTRMHHQTVEGIGCDRNRTRGYGDMGVCQSDSVDEKGHRQDRAAAQRAKGEPDKSAPMRYR